MNDDILIKYILRESNESEDRQVEEWLGQSDANAKQLSDFKLIWETSATLAAVSPVNEDQAWQRFKQLRSEKETAKVIAFKPSGISFLKIAATVVLVMSVGLLGYFAHREYRDPTIQLAETGNETKEITMPDGSQVTLNKNTVLAYPARFVGTTRSINLRRGEAFFNVARDKNHPFVIKADKINVQVVGTTFNIKLKQNQTRVIVETGIVKVTGKTEAVELRKGEQVTISGSNQKMLKEENSGKLYNYYRTKEFVADNTPLWQLVEVLNEAYNSNISIENPAIRDLKITTTFKEESLNKIVSVISSTIDVKVERRGNEIILK